MSETTPQDFHGFEQAGWEQVPAAYDRAFTELTAQSTDSLLDAVRVAPGDRLLDLCCGPGGLAAEAARRGARATGVDFSEAMVALAAQRHPQVTFRVGDAQALDLEDGAFDALTMAYGLLHLARPDDALREACRVLRPGGRVATVVWSRPERARGFELVLEAVKACGTLDAGLPPGPDFFRFSDEAECVRSFEAAGFEAVRCEEIEQLWHPEDADELFRWMLEGTVRTRGLMAAQSPADLERIRARIAREAEAFRTPAGLAIPMPAMRTRATRP